MMCHRGDPRTDRPDLAHANLIGGRFAYFALPDSPVTQYGGQLLEKTGCRRCHRSGNKGNLLASDLDQLLPGARPGDVLQSIRQPVLFMPDFGFAESTATILVNALFAHSAQAERPSGEIPMLVHFEGVERAENPFEKHCGGCHRLLTKTWGGLGQGNIGPNLSGLFSEFYPGSFKDEERWSPANLEKWLKNPRAIRKAARMGPQPLKPEELRQVLSFFETPAAASASSIPPGSVVVP
ncbi:MAG: cytochrome c [Desulfuromonadales bacterium]|nr:cytochrome c [Desulfuromonadales bacterium]